MVHHFYSTLFTSEPSNSMDKVLDAIPKKVTDDINDALCCDYTNDEIKTALFQMGPTKAPGPDGFPALFYQKHWDLLEEDICAAVKGFLLGSDIPEGFCDSKKEATGELKGIRNGRKGPPISHLLFADDSVFFTRRDERSIDALNSALHTYCNGSGQEINLRKSSIFFGPHCDDHTKERVKQKIGVHEDSLQATYLGMPTWVGRSPTNNFKYLTGRLWKRLNGALYLAENVGAQYFQVASDCLSVIKKLQQQGLDRSSTAHVLAKTAEHDQGLLPFVSKKKNFWDTLNFSTADTAYISEVIAVVPDESVQVCLVDIGLGTPFISWLELRPLKDKLYPQANATQALVLFHKANFGGDTTSTHLSFTVSPCISNGPTKIISGLITCLFFTFPFTFPFCFPSFSILHESITEMIRIVVIIPFFIIFHSNPSFSMLGPTIIAWYPDDPYDRVWTTWAALSWWPRWTRRTLQREEESADLFEAPTAVLQTAITPLNVSRDIDFSYTVRTNHVYPKPRHTLVLYVMEVEVVPNNASRVLYVFINGLLVIYPYKPLYLIPNTFYTNDQLEFSSRYNVTISAFLPNSTLPPIVNAAEFFSIISTANVGTFEQYGSAKGNAKEPSEVSDEPSESPNRDGLSHLLQLENRRFTYRELEVITNNFHRVLGRGGFGFVYAGLLEDGTQVAVKLRSQTSSQGVTEFLVEARNLTRIHHRNLVSLIGYCKDGDYLALVYEHMSEGNLQDKLRGRDPNVGRLTWRQRIRIALESAQVHLSHEEVPFAALLSSLPHPGGCVRPGEQASETPSVEILPERAIRFWERLAPALFVLFFEIGCFIDRSNYTMGDLNNTHGGGAAAGATFPSRCNFHRLVSAALKPSPFTGSHFKRWQNKTLLWLTAMGVHRVKRHEFSVENIMGSLDVEEKARAKDKHTGGTEGRSAANMVQKNAHKSKGKNKGVSHYQLQEEGENGEERSFWVCGEGHWANRCPQRKGKKCQAGQNSNSVGMVIGNTEEGTTGFLVVKSGVDDMNVGTIFESRDATFFEDIFPMRDMHGMSSWESDPIHETPMESDEESDDESSDSDEDDNEAPTRIHLSHEEVPFAALLSSLPHPGGCVHSRPGEQASETPSVEILHRETGDKVLGSVSARLLSVRALLRRIGCFIDRSNYTMGDLNNTHGGGAAAGATFPVAMYVLFLSYLALLLVPCSDLMHVLSLIPPFLHRDVKTSNILLNANLKAKVADFGLLKAFKHDDDTHASTDRLVGTHGYLAPEYAATLELTEKSDVYSFGVVLLEVITGQPPILQTPESVSITEWARKLLMRGNIEDVVDTCIQDCLELEESHTTTGDMNISFTGGIDCGPSSTYGRNVIDSDEMDRHLGIEMDRHLGITMGNGPATR
ncbi:hypothetical protein QYE76_014872 [Lolium multiflorum]|uniref:Protein kinase domain-containing protein n=1 Tax=Lolium multiflorum TaxID=4521 RepID=A0AAD8U5S6_LOLMU|nr:hypothetical protein QYE76_014872 [Lolium multiflorum]